MTPEQSKYALDQAAAKWSGKPLEQLLEGLTDCLRLTGAKLLEAAAIVGEIDRQGHDLSNVDGLCGLLPYLRHVAAGQMLPELLVKQLGNMSVLARARYLPFPDQQRVAEDAPLPVVIENDEGEFQTVLVAPSRMAREQVVAVFGGGHIKGEAEQIAATRKRDLPRKDRLKKALCRIDKKRGWLVIGDTVYLTEVELEAFLREMKSIRARAAH